MSCKAICSEGTSCIEAEPSEPEDKCAKSNEWNVMNTISSILITFSSTKDNANINALTPELICTTFPPAKSRNRSLQGNRPVPIPYVPSGSKPESTRT